MFDRDEKRKLAQVIINIMYMRPRMDFDANYFATCYRLQCLCLCRQTLLITSVLNKQVRLQSYSHKVHRTNQQADEILLLSSIVRYTYLLMPVWSLEAKAIDQGTPFLSVCGHLGHLSPGVSLLFCFFFCVCQVFRGFPLTSSM